MTIQVQKTGNLVQITDVGTNDNNYVTQTECVLQTSGESIWIRTSNNTYVAHYSDIYDESGQPKSSLEETLDYLSEFIG